ncbi:MAG: hypothetical protein EOP53_20965, partial [Sphingobacteriales bacterium]
MRIHIKTLLTPVFALIGIYFLFASNKNDVKEESNTIMITVYQNYLDTRYSKISVCDDSKITETI